MKGSITMKCPIESHENAELLLAYCAGKLDPQTTIILDRHLAACPACRRFQQEQQTVWDALDSWQAVPVSQDFDRRLYRRIEEEQAHASWWSRLTRPFQPLSGPAFISRGVPLAAAAGLLVLAGIILVRPNEVVVVPEDLASGVRMESVQPEQVERTLDDMEMLRQLKASTASDTGTM
jgi:anti-sigma factor RsiW